MDTNAEPVVVKQVYDASSEAVWRAITEKDQMCQWYFETIADFVPEQGHETEFTVRSDGKDYVHLWKVTEVLPQEKIVYSWRYGGHPGDSSVSWELSNTDTRTQLTLTHKGHENLLREEAGFDRENCVAAWKYFLCESLKNSLDGAA